MPVLVQKIDIDCRCAACRRLLNAIIAEDGCIDIDICECASKPKIAAFEPSTTAQLCHKCGQIEYPNRLHKECRL